MDPIIHKTVEVSPNVAVGEGTKIWNNSQIMGGAIIGKDCMIGHNCFIASTAKLGEGVKLESNIDVWDLTILENYVFIGPSVVFTNDLTPRAKYPKKKYPGYGKWIPTLVKEGASIGANTTVVCGNAVGKWALIGCGSVVTHDIPDYALAIGVPARVKGWVCECGNKLRFKGSAAKCQFCAKQYKKTGLKVVRSDNLDF
jgi:UDP-2-acetamido-3-amino-2,3-dideoxy-glucuronate N-acetyltransferase